MNIYRNITKYIRTACALLAVLMSVVVYADVESMQLGFGKDRSVTFLQVGNRGTGGSALFMPETTMGMYAGCMITEMHIDLGEPSGKDSVKVFITRSLNEAPLYEQSYTATKAGWNTVKLNTPFEIDGSALFIGYEVTGQYYLLYRNALIDGEEWIMQNGEDWKEYTDIYTASFYATVEGDNLPKNNIRLGNIQMPSYAVTDEPLNFSGNFVNLGLDDVSQLTFTCLVNGQKTDETVVNVDKTTYQSKGNFSFSGFGISSSGDKEVKIEVSAVNGQPDLDPSDNASATRKVTVVDKFVKRNVLFEVFSTEKCTSCPGQHEIIASAYEDVPDIIEVGHHAGFYEDKFTIPESKAYEWFYGNSRLYAPAVMYDRTSFSDNIPDYYTGECPVTGFNLSLLLAAYDEAISASAFADVKISHKLDRYNRRLDLTVSGKELMPLTRNDSIRLFLYLTEDSIYSDTQAGASEGFYHRYVIRRSLTGTWGDDIDIESGFSKDFTIEIPSDWDIDKVDAVAFVGYYTPDDVCGCNVLNTTRIRITSDESTGIEIIEAGKETPKIMFDGANIIIPGGYDSLSIFNTAGTCLMNSTSGGTYTPIGNLPEGVYIAKTTVSGRSKTVKFCIR